MKCDKFVKYFCLKLRRCTINSCLMQDPVNMAGYVASNMIEGLVNTVQWHEVDEIIRNGGLFIDVREPFEADLGTFENTVNIPLGQIRKRLREIPKDKEIYLYCQVGLRGYGWHGSQNDKIHYGQEPRR